MSQWVEGHVIEKKQWNPNLFSLRVQTPIFDFKPGQFVRLGIEHQDNLVHRAYSLVNQPGSQYIECFITAVENGEVSPLIQRLDVGDSLQVSQPASGFFILDGIPSADSLWMLCTGTGLGPYLSILQGEEVWQRFKKIVLVHGVRYGEDLAYRDKIQKIQNQYPQFIYQPTVSREHAEGSLKGRITGLIQSGDLEQSVGIPLDTTAQVMLCGNPEMIQDVRELLAKRDMRINLKRRPGNITVEQYWRPDT